MVPILSRVHSSSAGCSLPPEVFLPAFLSSCIFCKIPSMACSFMYLLLFSHCSSNKTCLDQHRFSSFLRNPLRGWRRAMLELERRMTGSIEETVRSIMCCFWAPAEKTWCGLSSLFSYFVGGEGHRVPREQLPQARALRDCVNQHAPACDKLVTRMRNQFSCAKLLRSGE